MSGWGRDGGGHFRAGEMAGEGELLLRETYSLERDLLPRPRTEDEVMLGEPMAKPKPEKKPAAVTPAPTRILPMELKIGDRLVDETGEWEVIGRPYTTAGGKNARVRVQRVGEPRSHRLRTWGAHERVGVKRTTAEEGKQ